MAFPSQLIGGAHARRRHPGDPGLRLLDCDAGPIVQVADADELRRAGFESR